MTIREYCDISGRDPANVRASIRCGSLKAIYLPSPWNPGFRWDISPEEALLWSNRKALTAQIIANLHLHGASINEIAAAAHCSRRTVFRYLKRCIRPVSSPLSYSCLA